jgi:hypothetical protein
MRQDAVRGARRPICNGVDRASGMRLTSTREKRKTEGPFVADACEDGIAKEDAFTARLARALQQATDVWGEICSFNQAVPPEELVQDREVRECVMTRVWVVAMLLAALLLMPRWRGDARRFRRSRMYDDLPEARDLSGTPEP